MVACILGVIIVGAVFVGVAALNTTFHFGGWGWNGKATTVFDFDSIDATNTSVEINIELSSGTLNLNFEENSTLLYRFAVEVQNNTLLHHGEPAVTFSSGIIKLNYVSAAVNLTLGCNVNYTIDVDITSGTVNIVITEGAHVGNIEVDVDSGVINLISTSGVILVGDPTFDISVTYGTVTIVVVLPSDVGGSIETSVTSGTNTITAPTWTEITSTHYETSDYGTASQSLTIIASVSSGTISASGT